VNLPPVTLNGRTVRLEPLGYPHAGGLLQAAAYDEIWTYLDEPTPQTEADITAFISDALDGQRKGTRLPFAVIRKHGEEVIGSTSYIDIRPADRTVEIGWTWLTPASWGTGANTECKYLLMCHAFESWHAGRVAIKTDAQNIRSRKAIEGLGATYEGTWRNHRLLSTGKYRDSAYYSVIDTEWPSVRERLGSATAFA
jgi:RimJ/RimL family protein N-acetyltransferase